MQKQENKAEIDEKEQINKEIKEKEREVINKELEKQIYESNDEKDTMKIAQAMKNNTPTIKTREKEIFIQGYLEKSKLYKKNKQEITFRLKKHQEYFIKGKIIKIINHKSSESDDFILVLKLKSNNQIAFCHWEIDFETMTPSNYNPIRYFIRDSISQTLKEEIFKRDNYKCQLKLKGCTEIAEELDHIIPISKGGLSIKENLQASCSNCNKKKSSNILI